MSEPSQALVSWVEQVVTERLSQAVEKQPLHWRDLGGDAGFRQYFRLSTTPATLAVVAPPATEKNHAFVAIADYLRERGLRVPRIIAFEDEQGFMLVEDLGHDLLLDHLAPDSVELLYGEALTSLLGLQQLPPDPGVFPAYSRELLRSEMLRFNEWFAQGLLGLALSEADEGLLDDVFQMLEDSAVEQPQVITHRDFHSRNLVHNKGSALGIIDFQDAVIGPLTYDLVSLLRDCYIAWPGEQVRRWALAYAGMVADVGLLRDLDQDRFLRWFDWMGLQRHIKVLGVFARLSLRDSKHGYLKDLPRVVDYVRDVAAQYPELANFSRWFDECIMPLVQRQDWYISAAGKG